MSLDDSAIVEAISTPLVLYSERSLPVDDLERYISRLDQDISRMADSYFFAIDMETLRTYESADARVAILSFVKRAAGKTCGFVTFDLSSKKHRVFTIVNDTVSEIVDRTAIITKLRQRDLAGIIDEKRAYCVLVAPPGTHFVT